jgi:hypothetical protein
VYVLFGFCLTNPVCVSFLLERAPSDFDSRTSAKMYARASQLTRNIDGRAEEGKPNILKSWAE